MSSATWHEPLERNPYFLGKDGCVSRTKKHDDIIKHTVDWTNRLAEAATTIASSVWTSSGPTLSAAGATTTTSYVTVTGTGKAKNTVTLANGQVLVHEVRFIGIDSETEDY